jgi:hypothetical protein
MVYINYHITTIKYKIFKIINIISILNFIFTIIVYTMNKIRCTYIFCIGKATAEGETEEQPPRLPPGADGPPWRPSTGACRWRSPRWRRTGSRSTRGTGARPRRCRAARRGARHRAGDGGGRHVYFDLAEFGASGVRQRSPWRGVARAGAARGHGLRRGASRNGGGEHAGGRLRGGVLRRCGGARGHRERRRRQRSLPVADEEDVPDAPRRGSEQCVCLLDIFSSLSRTLSKLKVSDSSRAFHHPVLFRTLPGSCPKILITKSIDFDRRDR